VGRVSRGVFAGRVGGELICISVIYFFIFMDVARSSQLWEMRPGLVIVKMGLFHRIPAPEHRHKWQGQHEGMSKYKISLGGSLSSVTLSLKQKVQNAPLGRPNQNPELYFHLVHSPFSNVLFISRESGIICSRCGTS